MKATYDHIEFSQQVADYVAQWAVFQKTTRGWVGHVAHTEYITYDAETKEEAYWSLVSMIFWDSGHDVDGLDYDLSV